MPRAGFWWVYVLERADGSYYTGISTDPRRRFEQHRSGKGGARANKVSAVVRILCLEPGGEYPLALRREAQIKGLDKEAKRLYVADPGSLAWPDPKGDWLHRKPGAKKKTKKKRKGGKRKAILKG
jgi:putative endonuclease